MEEAIFSSVFDNENINDVIKSIQENIKLRAIDAVDDAVKVISMLYVYKDTYLLSEVKDLIIYKGGITIVHLKNNKNQDSGKSIRVEIKTLGNEFTQLIQSAREQAGVWLYTLGAVATFLLSGWTFYKNM